MNIALYGTGRAAGALGIVFTEAGHTIVEVHGRSQERIAATTALFDVTPGTADLRIIAVSDDAIEEVAQLVAVHADQVPAIHVSGAASVAVLDPVGVTGSQVGSFHPLQTMPDPLTGAHQLRGAWIGITAPEPLHSQLDDLAVSIGCLPFALADAKKPLYHAAAAASANFVLAALAAAEELFDASGVPFDASKPLVDAIVENAFTLGPRAALTGPIARGDVATVARQLEAVSAVDSELYDRFVSLAKITASTAGTSDVFEDVLR